VWEFRYVQLGVPMDFLLMHGGLQLQLSTHNVEASAAFTFYFLRHYGSMCRIIQFLVVLYELIFYPFSDPVQAMIMHTF
jgi:hypothetical protein